MKPAGLLDLCVPSFIQVCVSEVGVPAASQTCSTHEWTDVIGPTRPGAEKCSCGSVLSEIHVNKM